MVWPAVIGLGFALALGLLAEFGLSMHLESMISPVLGSGVQGVGFRMFSCAEVRHQPEQRLKP